MKLSVKPVLLKLLAPAGGILGMLLYMTLYATGMDEKGLLIAGHWAGVTLVGLTLLVLAAVVLLTRGISGPDDCLDAYPASFLRGLGCFALAAALGVTGWKQWCTDTTLDTVVSVLMVAAAAAQLYVGICRMTGAKPLFLCNAVLCACFAIRMVQQYQRWSSDPQMMDYIFYLGAWMLLMLTAYQHTAFDADMGSHRVLWAASLAAGYLCVVALGGGEDIPLLLAGGIWALTNMTSLKPGCQCPAPNQEDESQEENL